MATRFHNQFGHWQAKSNFDAEFEGLMEGASGEGRPIARLETLIVAIRADASATAFSLTDTMPYHQGTGF
ncbi:hypothetical protein [Rhizobium tumorigenes]|uniref:Uncharacterized protein n=1 Tax=Rhizobium tumorigenes TaxID=2041385 RepID=A0AAF1KS38_9HYPH|nr:hypothetical protein [Rhizobium tumorigenes]WFR98160.1 hypothetical protein PR017_21275 [Rhizobium tumorigenes]